MSINSKDITVVVQGPIIPLHTKLCLSSIREYLPRARIILSTWNNSITTGLDCDFIIENSDPGYFILRDVFPNSIRNESANRQIVSTLAGLNQSKTKYSIKMRSDLVLKSNKFINYYETFNNEPFDLKFKLTKERVLMLTTVNPKRRFKHPFSMSDWFYFGLTVDLLDIFDIPLMSENNMKGEKKDGMYSVESNYSTEQWLWFYFLLKKVKINFSNFIDISGDNIVLSEKYIANNSIILPAKKIRLDSLKYPGASYAQIPCLSYSGLYTFNEYKGLLNKYSNSKLLIIPNILEYFTYLVVYNMRFWIKKINPKFHDLIARIINPKNHRKNIK